MLPMQIARNYTLNHFKIKNYCEDDKSICSFFENSCVERVKILNVLQDAVFWDVAPCGFIINRCFGGYKKPTQHHIPEDDILYSHRRENFKSYVKSLVSLSA
jgi:hypothetical protein